MGKRSIKHKIALILLVLSVFIACNSNEKPQASGKEKQQTFTCPMHPQVIKHEAGSCPVCGMDLVPFEKSSNDAALKIDQQRQALANITTLRIGENTLSGAKQLNGRLTVNPEQSSYVSSRIAGRIEQLYIRETGIKVNKGQALYKLYSEQLETLQQEYLMAVAQEKQFQGDKIEQQIVASARQKLLLYGQSEQQLRQLLSQQQKDPFVTFYAPETGVVAELNVTQGQYVTAGSPIMRLEGYAQLWVEADVYPDEAAKIKPGQKVQVVVAGWEDQPKEMVISFITPSLQSGTQLMQVRGSIPNPDNQWQPGLQANVFLPSANSGQVLSLPSDAVIRDGKGNHVWIKSGKDSFEPRLVKTGTENENQIEISAGLHNGEQVVVTGAYLLYSEYVLKKGKNPSAGLEIQ